MSLHKSLKTKPWSAKRTVRKRRERLDTLYADLLRKGGLSEKDIKIYGLPKERIIVIKPKKKEKKEETETTTGTIGSI